MKTLGKWMKTNVGLLFAVLPIFALAAEPALAQNLDPLENMLQTVVDALTGPIGRLIAILAVVAAGYMMFTGRLNPYSPSKSLISLS